MEENGTPAITVFQYMHFNGLIAQEEGAKNGPNFLSTNVKEGCMKYRSHLMFGSCS